MSNSRIKVQYVNGDYTDQYRWLDPLTGKLFLGEYDPPSTYTNYGFRKSAAGGWVNDGCGARVVAVHLPEQPAPVPPRGMRTAAQVFADAADPGASLETRKNGKVQMELVVGGFPHLHWELGRMMTWAQVEKGYKPHDWKNYGAETFLGAAERHRNKRLRGETVDSESGLSHLVHEAFNLMAAAEVALMKEKK